jgi:hypothetical protein
MRLSEAQSRELLRKHDVYIAEACDKCRKVLGHVRFTRYGQTGEWYSRLCRDGVEHKAGACYGCGVGLKAKRKGALFCSGKMKECDCSSMPTARTAANLDRTLTIQ